MGEKLNAGDAFPALTLDLVRGGKVRLPERSEAGYRILLFYRGHW